MYRLDGARTRDIVQITGLNLTLKLTEPWLADLKEYLLSSNNEVNQA